MTIDFRVMLLGNGVPIPTPERFGPCTSVEAGDQKFLIDAGRGATKYGKDVDLLVHEVAMARPELMKDASIQRIVGHHTSPYDCGRVFAQTRPKLAAFTHVVQLASPTVPPPTLDELMAEVRAT